MKNKSRKGIQRKSIGLAHFQGPDEFGRWLGYRLAKLDRKKKRAVIELEIRRDHLSPSGRAHGGVVSACLDAALGVAVFTTLGPRDFTATIEPLKVNYLRPLALGDKIKIDASLVFRGKRLAVAHGFLYANRSKQPAAMATGTFTIVADSPSRSRSSRAVKQSKR